MNTGTLFVVATPIGDPEDITLRAIRTMRECDVIIGEEAKEVRALLKRLDIPFQNLGPELVENAKQIELLNEHSSKEDIQRLAQICQSKKVALVSDCGTPGFCDPGAELVDICRNQGIKVTALPGASSLMSLLSIAGKRLNEFVFVGFLPANNEERDRKIKSLKNEKRSFVIMDTPYRLQKTVEEMANAFGESQAVLGLNLTQSTEQILTGKLTKIKTQLAVNKAEFIMLIIRD